MVSFASHLVQILSKTAGFPQGGVSGFISFDRQQPPQTVGFVTRGVTRNEQLTGESLYEAAMEVGKSG